MPELAPLAAKYHSDLEALAQARSRIVGPARQVYLAGLAAAEQKATTDGKQNELQAIKEEMETLAAGLVLKPKASPWLPQALATPRAFLLRDSRRAEHEYAIHSQQAGTEYLRALSFYENKARAANQAVLLQQIEAEKLKIAGQGTPASSAGNGTGAPTPIAGGPKSNGSDADRNLVRNGDFKQATADGMAENWSLGRKVPGGVASERELSYFRFVNPDGIRQVFSQSVDRPANANEVIVKLRMRSAGLKGHGEYGMVIRQLDAQQNELARDTPVRVSAPVPEWTRYTGTVRLLAETKKIQIRGFIDGLTGAVDFCDLRAEPR